MDSITDALSIVKPGFGMLPTEDIWPYHLELGRWMWALAAQMVRLQRDAFLEYTDAHGTLVVQTNSVLRILADRWAATKKTQIILVLDRADSNQEPRIQWTKPLTVLLVAEPLAHLLRKNLECDIGPPGPESHRQ